LGVRLRGARCVGVNAWIVLVVAEARFEGAVLGIVGCVVGASDTVEDVFAEMSGVGACGVARFEAEEIAAHEAELD
jgi:hypothetical protein